MLLCDSDILHSHINEPYRSLKTTFVHFRPDGVWRDIILNAIIVMVSTYQGLNIFGYDNAVIDVKTLSCNCKLFFCKDGFKCHLPLMF